MANLHTVLTKISLAYMTYTELIIIVSYIIGVTAMV